MLDSSAPSTVSRRDLWLLVLAVIVCRILVARACPTYDDAFITYRYARNFADGNGLVFNPGAAWEPVLGITTPLYGLILSGFARLGFDLVTVSLAFNIVCDALTGLLLPRLFGNARGRSTATLLCFAVLPPLVRITLGGMESPLFVLTGLSACLALASGRPVLSGCAAAATCLVRPEGVLLCGVLAISRWKNRPELLRFAWPIAAIGAIGVAWLASVYGSPIPHSVTAKAATDPADTMGESWSVWKSVLQHSFCPQPYLLPLVPFMIFGAVRALRSSGPLRWFSFWALAITASYLIARPHMWGWYFAVPLVAWSTWTGIGLAGATRWASARCNAQFVRFASAIVAPAGLIAIAALAGYTGATRPTSVNSGVYAPLAKWASETSSAEPQARVMAADIGAIGWHWKGTVLDSMGLVWPAALAYGSPNAIIAGESPEYLMLYVDRFTLRQFRARADLYARYEPIARFSAFGLKDLEPRLEDVDVNWSQDYLIYRRR